MTERTPTEWFDNDEHEPLAPSGGIEVRHRSGIVRSGTPKEFRWIKVGEMSDVLHWRPAPAPLRGLPADPAARKNVPIYSGVLMYFPDAIAAVAECSKKGNDQHNPGQPLHWNRAKSGDELDALTRHLMEAGTVDTDGIRHSAKIAWRALANLQKEIERERDADQTRLSD